MPSYSRPSLPAVIVGFEQNGLAVARALHAQGVECVGIGAPGRQPTHATRACRVVSCAEWSEAGLLDCLRELARTLPARTPVLITKDEAVLWISRNRESIGHHFAIGLPDRDIVELLMTKSRFQQLAESRGWPVPFTIAVASEDDLAAALGSVRYPCIVKPAVRTSRFRRNVAEKVFHVRSQGQLLELYRRLAQWEPEMVIQEWIEGGDDCIAYCLAYYGRSGEPLALYPGRKLRQYPVDHGVTAVAAPAPPEWREALTRLTDSIFRDLGYRGLGSVEYKMRPDGSPVIMEPTVGRTNWQSEIAVINGINIPYVAYSDLAGAPCPPMREAPRGVKLVDGRGHRRASLQLMRQGRFRLRDWLSERRGASRHMLWRTDDPAPFLAAALVAPVRRVLRRVRANLGRIVVKRTAIR